MLFTSFLSFSDPSFYFYHRVYFFLIDFTAHEQTLTWLSLPLCLQIMEKSSSNGLTPSFKQVLIQDNRDPRSSSQDLLTGGEIEQEVNAPNFEPYSKGALPFYGAMFLSWTPIFSQIFQGSDNFI